MTLKYKRLIYSGLFLLFTASLQAQVIDTLVQFPITYFEKHPREDSGMLSFDDEGNMLLTVKVIDDIVLEIDGETVTFEAGTGGYSSHLMMKTDADFNVLWAKEFLSGEGNTDIEHVHTDDEGHMYITGILNGTFDFDPSSAVANYTIADVDLDANAFMAKYTEDGTLLWVKLFPAMRVVAALEKPEGGLFIAGSVIGQATVDLNPGGDPVIVENVDYHGQNIMASYDSDGLLEWHHAFEAGVGGPANLAFASDGLLLVSGSYSTNTVDGTQLDVNPSDEVLYMPGPAGRFIAKWTPSGEMIWTRSFGRGASFDNFVRDMKCDNEGNILIAGTAGFLAYNYHTDTAQSAIVDASAGGMAYLLKLDTAGHFQWVHGFPNNVSGTGIRTTSDGAGDVYLSYSFQGSFDADPGEGEYWIQSQAGTDIALIKLHADGTFAGAFAIVSQGSNSDGVDRSFCFRKQGDHLYLLANFKINMQSHPGMLELESPSKPAMMTLFRMGSGSCGYFNAQIAAYTPMTCAAPGYIEAEASMGLLPYTYAWDGPVQASTAAIEFNAAGAYHMLVSDANGCATSTTILVPETDLTGPDLGADPQVNLITDEVRPGFESFFILAANNFDCEPSDGVLTFHADNYLNLASADPPPSEVLNDTLVWNYTGLTSDEAFTVHLLFDVDVAAPIGDSVQVHCQILPDGTNLSEGNDQVSTLLPVVNSYDPNDKQLMPQGECLPNYLPTDTLLHYTIRFQNEGNSFAIFVHILDTMDTALDLSTLRIVAQSHPMVMEMEDAHTLRFRFDQIFLPPASSTWEGSQGYVSFEIYTADTVAAFEEISNFVDIYFDFNPPITTNTVMHTTTDGSHRYEVELSVEDHVLSAPDWEDASYQWVLCEASGGFSPIEGATGPVYAAEATGDYALVVNRFGCEEISACASVTLLGLGATGAGPAMQLFPNPASEGVRLQWPAAAEVRSVAIADVQGRVHVRLAVTEAGHVDIDIAALPPGLYFVLPFGEKAYAPLKLVK